MRIAHNMEGIIASNRLNLSNKKVSRSINKLSSGFLVNIAADDAAGLSISEKMRAQIRGVRQGERNVQDGISMIQTIDGNLSEMTEIVQRIRELSVQAANGVLTDDDREKIQDEVDQLKEAMDTIANEAEFNTRKVLMPPIDEENIGTKTAEADIVFVIDNTGSMAETQTKVANNIVNFINKIASKGVTNIRMGIVEYTDNDIIKSNFNGGDWTTNIGDIYYEIMKFSNTNRGGTENAMAAISKAANEYDFIKNKNEAKSNHIVFITDEDADDDIKKEETLGLIKDKGIVVHGVYYTNNNDIEEFDYITSETGGKSVNLADTSWGTDLSDVIGNAIGDSATAGIEGEDMPSIHLQVGPNKVDSFIFKLFDMRSHVLGIKHIFVGSSFHASNTIGIMDKVFNKINNVRSKFGAYQNRLEHTYNNLTNYEENLQSSESRIRDLDMAKEIMELTKNSIIQQATQAMLIQSKHIPENVLQLLK